MESIFDAATRNSIRKRIEALKPDAKREWGQMSVNEMICHLTDPLRDSLGDREARSSVPFFLKPIIKWTIMSEKPFKQGEPTLKIFRETNNGGGTKPTTFEHDKKALLEYFDRFVSVPESFEFRPHAGAGKLTREENGKLVWKHLDHHLRQFSA